MKSRLWVIILILALPGLGRAQEPVPLAHGNVPGEPHHHLKIENEYVRVYYVEAPPHESTLLHQHDHDYIYVSLGASDVVNAIVDKPEIHLQLKDGETHFTRGGFAHVARNLADTPFRNITIELLKPQGDAHNLCSQIVPGQPFNICEPPLRADFGTQREFQTAEISMDRVWLQPNAKHTETHRVLIVWLGDSGIKATVKDKPAVTARGGAFVWFDGASGVELSNDGSKVGEFLKIAFKDAKTHSPKT